MVEGRVGYQTWQEFRCFGLELVCHECLGQLGIWTSFDGELCQPHHTSWWKKARDSVFFLVLGRDRGNIKKRKYSKISVLRFFRPETAHWPSVGKTWDIYVIWREPDIYGLSTCSPLPTEQYLGLDDIAVHSSAVQWNALQCSLQLTMHSVRLAGTVYRNCK